MGSEIVKEVLVLRWLHILIVIMLIFSVTIITPPQAEGASEAIGVNLIVNNFLNDSTAKALSWVVFDGAKPSKNNVDNVTFRWYDPMGILVFTEDLDPDTEAVAWSYYQVNKLGEWSVNVTYKGNSSIWNNKSFEVVPDIWGPGDYHVTGTTLVSHNATLTIEPGTTVLFDDGKGLGVEGRLMARGTGSDPIIFTSNLSTKSPGDWTSITFFNSSNDSSVIDNVRIEYSREGLELFEASPLVANSTFINNKERAIYTELSQSHIINNHISRGVGGITPWGIYSAASNHTIRDNIIEEMYIGLYLLNSNLSRNASIKMQDNIVENCVSYGMFVKNSIIYSLNDRFVGNNKGVLMDSESDAIFEKLTITGGLEGFTASGSSTVYLLNSTVEEVSIATFVLSDDSRIYLLNCSFATLDSAPGVSIDSADSSMLFVRNFLTVKTVSFDNGSVLSDVLVQVFDGVDLIHQVNTDMNGLTQRIVVTDRVYMPTLIENVTRVLVALGNLSFQNNNRSVTMNTSHSELFLGSEFQFNDTDMVPPFVIDHYPDDDLTVLNIIITISFSEAMQNDTVEENFSITPYVPGLFTWVNNVLIFVPQGLTANTFYTVSMGKGAKDLANNSMASSYQFSFTTLDITDVTAPYVLTIFPIGTDVPVDIQYINITFSKEMQKFSTERAFSIEPRVPGIFSWDGNTLRFRPIYEFSEQTVYKVTINGSIAQDNMGNALDGNLNGVTEGSPVDDYSWEFKTRRTDFTPPRITNAYPSGNMVDTEISIKIYFSEAMNISSVIDGFSYTNGTVTWTSENGSWGKSVYIMNFIPDSPFNYSQVYTVTIKGTAEDLLTNTLDGNGNGAGEGSPIDDYTWSFRTIYDPDIGLPLVNEVSPWGTGIDIGAEVSINFSQAMNQQSAEEALTITDGITVWDRDDGTFIWDGNKSTFIPDFTLNYFTNYTVRINITAKNIVGEQLDGNENGLPDDYTLDSYSWNFSTGGAPELAISYVSVDDIDARNQSDIWYVDSGGIVPIGVNITNIGYSNLLRDFRVTLHNLSDTGQPLNITINSLGLFQDSGTLYFQWPAPTYLGDHFVEIIVDWVNEITEVNEDNNTFLLHFAIGPDYTVANISVNGMDASDPDITWYVDLGLPVEIKVDVKNIGFSGVSPFSDFSIAYVNSTALGTPIDSPFTVISGLPGVGAGESSGDQLVFWYIPNDKSDFYVVIIIDYDDTTVEIDEGNNEFVLHFAFSPDYVFANVQVSGNPAIDPKIPWNATSGELVPIGVNITNLGLSGVGDSVMYNLSFYNSTNRGTPVGAPFYYTNLPGLFSNEDSGEVIGFWLPPNIVGDFYVAVIIDPLNELPEESEGNNVFVLHLVIGPDIITSRVMAGGQVIINSPSNPIFVGPNDNITIDVNVSNFGSSGTGADFFLALFNGTREGGMIDSPYLNISIPALSSKGFPGSDSGTVSLFWPSKASPGTYYVVIYCDISNIVAEKNDNNNMRVLTFVISPDLVPNNITVDGVSISSYPNETVFVLPGESIQIGALASNIGSSPTGSVLFGLAYFNSTDSGINLGAQFAEWISLGPLSKLGTTSDVYATWIAPNPGVPTDYYINISVDHLFAISETSETNNYVILHVRIDGPDLTPNRIMVEGDFSVFGLFEDPYLLGLASNELSIPLGTNLTITFDVINVGGLEQSSATNVTFYNTSTLYGPANATPFFETPPLWILLSGRDSPASDETNEVGQTVIAQWVNPNIMGVWYINITIDFGNSQPEFNEFNNTFTLIINVTDYPVTSISPTQPSYFGAGLYVNSSTQLSFNVNGENPPFYTWYRIMDLFTGSIVKNWSNHTLEGVPFSMIWGEGVFKIDYYSNDSVGKMEAIKFTIVVVDDEKPQADITFGDPRYRGSPTDILNISSGTSILVSSTDLPTGALPFPPIFNASGIKEMYYRIQNMTSGLFVTPWVQAISGVPFYLNNPSWGDGLYRIWYNSSDNLDQEDGPYTVDVYLDNTGPNIIISVGNPKQPHPTWDWYVNSFTTFTMDALEENGSGANLSSILFRIVFLDSGLDTDWIQSSSFDIDSMFILEDGNYSIEFQGSDHLGNTANFSSIFIYLDDTAPIVSLGIDEHRYREFPNEYWNVSQMTGFNFSGEDGFGCGVNNIQYRVFNSTYDSGWTVFFFEFNLTGLDHGTYRIEYFGIDRMGNFHIYQTQVFLDLLPPETEISMGEPKSRDGIQDLWNVTSQTPISIEFLYDNGSGPGSIQYKIVNATFDSGWLNYTGEVLIDPSFADGNYTLYYRGFDNIDNMESARSIDFRLDNTGPVSSIVISGTFYGQYVSFITSFTKNADDGEGSGVNTRMHRIFSNDTGLYYTGWLSSTMFNLPSHLLDGTYTIEFFATDTLANLGSVGYLTITLDDTPPTSAIEISEPKFRLRKADDWMVAKNTSFSFMGQDGTGSGFGITYYTIRNNDNDIVVLSDPYTGPFNLSGLGEDGRYTILFHAEDNLGNVESEDKIFVILDTIHPRIIHYAPTGQGNSPHSYIQVVFNENMNHERVEEAFNVTGGSQVLDLDDGFFNWNGNIMRFYPYERLEYNTDYIVTVNITASDLVGNNLDGDGDGIFKGDLDIFFWIFNTQSLIDSIPPTVVFVSPSDGEENVSVDTYIVIEFSEIMDELSVEAAFSINDGKSVFTSSSGSFVWVNQTFNFTLNSPFLYETLYTVTISGQARDISGNFISISFQWSFRTQKDRIAPVILAFSPTGENVSVETLITVKFNEPMSETVSENAIILIPGVNGTLTWDDNTLIFTPESDLKYLTEYYVTIGIELADTAGNHLQFPFVFSFITEPDTYSPYVIDHSPSGSDVSITSNITVTFNEEMDHDSVEQAFIFSTDVEGTFVWENNTVIYVVQELEPSTIYTITLSTQAMDISGNPFSEPYQFSFTTQKDPDPPFIIQVIPTGSNVSVNTQIVVRFSESMNQSSLQGALIITPHVTGTISFSGDSLTFIPNVDLKKGTVYNVTVLKKAKDEAGNSMVFDYSWEFETEPAKISSSSPFPWDVVFFGIFMLAIVLIIFLVLYEFVFKKRREGEDLDESLETEGMEPEKVPDEGEWEGETEDEIDDLIESIQSSDEDMDE
jgi:hypothetical protein